jgi:hypothetical protein
MPAGRLASSVFRRLQPRPMMMMATTRKQVAPVWCVSWLPQAAAKARCSHPRTTLRSTSRRLSQTTSIRQAQAQGLWHDEEFHGLRILHLRHGTR